MHPYVPAVPERVNVVPLPACDAAFASRVVRDVSQYLDSQFLSAHTLWALTGSWNSSLLDLFLVFSDSQQVLMCVSLILPRHRVLNTGISLGLIGFTRASVGSLGDDSWSSHRGCRAMPGGKGTATLCGRQILPPVSLRALALSVPAGENPRTGFLPGDPPP